MSDIIKSIRLDFLLGKKYIKYLIYFIIISIFLIISNKNLTFGIITTMTLISLKIVSFVFQCEEKSDLDKLYGFIPIKKVNLVLGRYCYMLIIGVIVLIISIIIQSIFLIYMNYNVELSDYFTSFCIGITIYIYNISLQLPGFYKFGSIKGSMFSYIPIIFFLLSFYLIGGLQNFGVKTLSFILSNLNLYIIVFFVVSIVFLLISIKISLTILKIEK